MMINQNFAEILHDMDNATIIASNFVSFMPDTLIENQAQTKDVFSDKWSEYDYKSTSFASMERRQKDWYLSLYGFANEEMLASHLRDCQVALDAGAGMGYKAAWFAELSPSTLVHSSRYWKLTLQSCRALQAFGQSVFHSR